MTIQTVNFEFVRDHDPAMYRELALAERLVHEHPSHTLMALRRIVEAIVSLRLGEAWEALPSSNRLEQGINRLGYDGFPFVKELHRLRQAGNEAVHDQTLSGANRRSVREAIDKLQEMHEILVHVFEASCPTFTEPPARSLDGDTARMLEMNQALAEAEASREQAEREAAELASIWPPADREREHFQNMTRRQLRDFVESVDCASFESAFRIFAGCVESDPEEGADVGFLEAQRELQERIESQEDERTRLEEQLARQEAELVRFQKQMLERGEWTDEHPGDDWSRIPAFMKKRLLDGLPPFVSWLTVPSLIGEGTHGAVYRCFPETGGVPVAVKIPRAAGDPEEMQRAWNWELDAARELAGAFASNPQGLEGVPRPLDISPVDRPAFVSYEIVDGRTLRDVLRHDGTIHPRRALFLIDRLSWTLQSLLRHGIRFTDLHDRNVMIRPGGVPMLVDIAPCVPASECPPEWSGRTRHEGSHQVVRSGQHYLLARLFLRMIGVGDVLGERRQVAQSSMDGMLQTRQASSEEERRARQRSGVEEQCRGIPDLDGNRLAGLLDDLVFRPESRTLKPKELREQLRAIYDPSGVMGTIYADS